MTATNESVFPENQLVKKKAMSWLKPPASPGRNCTCGAGYDFDAKNFLPDSKRRATAVTNDGGTRGKIP